MPVRVVVAPDKFKGSLTASEATSAIAAGLRCAWPDASIIRLPMADGGEGTVDLFVEGGAFERRSVPVRDALGSRVEASFAYDAAARCAVIEMAAASGLARIAEGRRDVARATSAGTGDLIVAALDCGARRIVVTLGGSATNDGGAGMLAVLGFAFIGTDGAPLSPGGAALVDLARIDASAVDPRLRDVRFEVAADVDHPLLGPRGATRVFGPQKGATEDDVVRLERALHRFADLTAIMLGRDLRDEAGTGAAGGLGFALRAYLGATMRAGAEVVSELRGLPEALRASSCCFTGEGSIDMQTLGGKTVAGVAALARDLGVPTVAFGGRVSADAEVALAARGVIVVPISDGSRPSNGAFAYAARDLTRAALRTARLIGVEFPRPGR